MRNLRTHLNLVSGLELSPKNDESGIKEIEPSDELVGYWRSPNLLNTSAASDLVRCGTILGVSWTQYEVIVTI